MESTLEYAATTVAQVLGASSTLIDFKRLNIALGSESQILLSSIVRL